MPNQQIQTITKIKGKSGSQVVDAAFTPEGHLEVALHDPILPFGSIHTESLTPIFQTDAVYRINQQQTQVTTSLSGSAICDDALFKISTGTTQFAQAVLQSRKRLRYRAGQGVIGRFTAKFTTGVADSYQLAGFGHAEDGVYVGYKDADLGILYVNRGKREIRTLTITTGASVSGNVTITLNGVAFTIAVTNSSNIQRTVYEISQGTYAGWDAYPSGTTIIFIRKSSGVANGSYSFSAGTTGSAGTIAQTRAGAVSTDQFIARSQWNGDKLDGTGASGVTIDPTKLNIFQISFGYLGTDAVVFKAKVCFEGNNNSTWITFHTIKLPNSLNVTTFRNPSLPFTLAVYSAESTTDLTLSCGSFAGFIEGGKYLHGGRFTYGNTLTTVGAVNYQALFTILNPRVYAGISNQSVINLLSTSASLKHTSPCTISLIKNGTLAGNPNFVTKTDDSCSLWDTSATTVTITDGYQELWSGQLGDTGELDHHFMAGDFNGQEITLQPGEWVTLAAKSVAGTPSYVVGSINTREDQ